MLLSAVATGEDWLIGRWPVGHLSVVSGSVNSFTITTGEFLCLNFGQIKFIKLPSSPCLVSLSDL